MYKISSSGRFKRDLKLVIRRGCDTALLDAVVTTLAEGFYFLNHVFR
jgi:mRNA-degrading endonuclease YafQ of YafQ-DinJ toxin-antitoxin module